VNPAKIVVRHKQGECMPMVFNGLAVANGQSRKPPRESAGSEVKPFAMARIDFAWVWIAKASAAADA
jgi:hypothetical protein